MNLCSIAKNIRTCSGPEVRITGFIAWSQKSRSIQTSAVRWAGQAAAESGAAQMLAAKASVLQLCVFGQRLLLGHP